MYYVAGDYTARKGVEVGTLHAAPERPAARAAAGAAEATLGHRTTNELAVMCDTFRPLKLTTLAARPRRARATPSAGTRTGRRSPAGWTPSETAAGAADRRRRPVPACAEAARRAAAEQHRARRAGPHAWMLGRFLCPASKLRGSALTRGRSASSATATGARTSRPRWRPARTASRCARADDLGPLGAAPLTVFVEGAATSARWPRPASARSCAAAAWPRTRSRPTRRWRGSSRVPRGWACRSRHRRACTTRSARATTRSACSSTGS